MIKVIRALKKRRLKQTFKQKCSHPPQGGRAREKNRVCPGFSFTVHYGIITTVPLPFAAPE